MLQAKQCFEQSDQLASLHEIHLPWALDANETQHIEQIMNCQINNSLPFIPILSWMKIALNIDYLVPGENHLFFKESNTSHTDCFTSFIWQQFHLKLIDICNTQDTHAALLLALFSGNTDVMELLDKVRHIPMFLNHICVFSKYITDTYQYTISTDGSKQALFYCFQTWSTATLDLKHVFPYDDSALCIDTYYGHPWIVEWLKAHPNVICAGGSIVNCLNNTVSDSASDIDLFVNSYEDWKVIALSLQELVPQPSPLVTQGCLVTWLCPLGYGNIQLIYSKFKTPEELISYFDMDYVQVWFENGIYKTSGQGAIAWDTKIASPTQPGSKPKHLRLLKAIEKGFQVEGMTDAMISDLKKSTLYQKNKNKHLHDILPNSDINRALFLANAIFKDSGVIIYETIHKAFENHFQPSQFGAKQSILPNTTLFEYDTPPSTTLTNPGVLPSSEIISPEHPILHYSHYFKIEPIYQTSPQNNNVISRNARRIIPAIQIEPGSLCCTFGISDIEDCRLNGSEIRLNIKNTHIENENENEKVLDAFQTISQFCTSALNDEFGMHNEINTTHLFLKSNEAYVDLRVYIDQNTILIDSKTNLPIKENYIPAGSYLDCVLILNKLNLPTTTMRVVYSKFQIIRAKVIYPPHIYYYNI